MIDRDSDELEPTSPEQEAADKALLTVSEEEAPEPAAEPAAEPEQPRDEQGRFAKETPKDEEPEAAEAEAAPSPEIPAEPTEDAVADEAPAETLEDEPDEPAVYRADGQEFAIPDSAVGEDGVFIPTHRWTEEVQPLLSAGKAAFGSVRQRLSDAASREQEAVDRAAAAEARLSHELGTIEKLIGESRHAKTWDELAQTPLGQWMANVVQNWAILEAEGKAKAIELKYQQEAKQLQTYRDQEQSQRIRPLKESSLRQAVAQYGDQLDEQTREAVFRELSDPDMDTLVFVKAPMDDPAGGFRKGELVLSHSVVQRAVKLASLNRPAPQQMQKIAQAQAQNAKLQPRAAKVPPTVAGKGRSPKQGAPAFKTADEADDFLVHGDLDSLVAD